MFSLSFSARKSLSAEWLLKNVKNVIVSKTREGGGRKCVGRYSLVYQRGLTGPTPTPPLNSSKSVETFLSKCSAPKIFGFYINWRHIWNQTKVILYLAVGSWNYSSLALALQ